MSYQIFQPLLEFGLTVPQLETLRQRLNVPQIVYVCGPAGGGKTRLALLIAWTYFQAYKRPFRMDGAEMNDDQIKQSAKARNCGILFNDMTAVQDYAKAELCLKNNMVAIGVPFDGPAGANQAKEYLQAFLPAVTSRSDVTIIGVGRPGDAARGRSQIDLLTL
jgi:ABC-type uncharacterized transport system YnjBCD ATPase subunit